MDPETIALLLNIGLILLLIISFFYVLCDQYISDKNLFDRIILPPGDAKKITYIIEPTPIPGENVPFPSVFHEPSLYVSFVIPAYNEEKRLPKMLDPTLQYLRSRQNQEFTWEIIVVDDGSKDNTANLVLQFARQNPEIRLLRQPVNMGKGAAVQAGCLHARGSIILMVDADGATEITDFGKLEGKIHEQMQYNKEAIVVGSRAHLEEEEKASRTPLRNFLGSAFHTLILLAGVRGIQDTQCGFKLFSRDAAKWLFSNQHIERWCFDPELLVIAHRRKMEIAEVAVQWTEIDGSLMRFSGMVKMGLDLLRITFFYAFGFWTIQEKKHPQIITEF